MWPFGKLKKVITLDIGSHSIKLAEFSIQKKFPVLEHFAFFPLSEDHISSEGVLDIVSLKEPFTEFIKKNTQDSFQPYVGIGGRGIIIKKLEIPRVEQSMMDELVEIEVRHNLPFNLEDINYHYQVMDVLKPKLEDRLNVLLVGANKNIVSNCDQLIKSTGYECATIDISSLALADCMKLVYPDIKEKNKTVLLLDIGKIGTNFMVIYSDQVIFQHYIPFGSNKYNDNLIREMNVDFQEAESLKLSSNFKQEVPKEVIDILQNSTHELYNEIIVGSEYLKNQFTDIKLSECYITGGGSQILGLDKIFEEKLKIPIHILDFTSFVEFNDLLVDKKDYIKNFLPVGVGLCMRNI